MNTEQLIKIARECGAVIDVLCMGRHDNVVFTSGEIQRFVQRIEQPYIDAIEDLHEKIEQLREALQTAKAMGFFSLTMESSVTHRDLCKAVDKILEQAK